MSNDYPPNAGINKLSLYLKSSKGFTKDAETLNIKQLAWSEPGELSQ